MIFIAVKRAARVLIGTGIPSSSAIMVMAALVWSSALAAPRLPSYNVDIAQTSVSGISSGGYMAGQFHVAYSSTLVGAGIIAGGPYYCARGDLLRALNQCMDTVSGDPNPAQLFQIALDLAAAGKVDELLHLAGQRVYIFSGTNDNTVKQRVVDKTREFYRLAGVPASNIEYIKDLNAGHAMITTDYGNACTTTASPYINDCDYDQAEATLRHIYGALDPPATALSGQIIEFDQGEFIIDPRGHSMNEVGYVYVPAACGQGEPCRIHIAFHGCRQTTVHIGDQFYTHAGYNAWADTNGIIVLYPQALEGSGNPRGCWDWWGYDDPGYATKGGRQMAAVKAMLDRLAQGRHDGDVTPPAAPSGLQVDAVSDTTVALSWTPNTEPDLAGYNVYRFAASNGSYTRANSALVTAPRYTVDQLDAQTTYYFVVDAADTAGNPSEKSEMVEATTREGYCSVYDDANSSHWLAGRARWCLFWFVCAVGSGENLGSFYSHTTLYEHPQGYYTTTPCGT